MSKTSEHWDRADAGLGPDWVLTEQGFTSSFRPPEILPQTVESQEDIEISPVLEH